MFSRRAQRHISLLALFVLVWGLVFPTLAQAGVGDTNAVWTEICTAQGVKKVQQASASLLHMQPDQSGLGHHETGSHCVLCYVGGSLPLPDVAALPSGLTVLARAADLPEPDVVIPQPVVLLNAPPRAPPFFPL